MGINLLFSRILGSVLFISLCSFVLSVLSGVVSGSEKAEVSSISFGSVVLGENRVPLNLDEFKIHINVPGTKVLAQFIKDSFQWVRVDGVLLIPRVRLAIFVAEEAKNLGLRYQGKSILLQSIGRHKSYSEFFVSLYYPDAITLSINGQQKGQISFQVPSQQDQHQERQLIDYSCVPFNLEIQGLEGEFYSAGCQLVRKGSIGQESAALEISWVTPNFRLLDESRPPYVASLNKNYPIAVTLKNKLGERRVVTLSAQVPTELPRLKTALGIGPYLFATEDGQSNTGRKWTSPLMLYANFYLTQNSSLRGFEAFFYNKSLFNNFGLYFAYDLGTALDNRFKITPLIGFQGLTFRHGKEGRKISAVIYPQGFELSYAHAFGLNNHTLVYGMFFSPRKDEDYKNLWLRFGRRVFWEINFLSWKEGPNYTHTWGLSVGLPFLTFF